MRLHLYNKHLRLSSRLLPNAFRFLIWFLAKSRCQWSRHRFVHRQLTHSAVRHAQNHAPGRRLPIGRGSAVARHAAERAGVHLRHERLQVLQLRLRAFAKDSDDAEGEWWWCNLHASRFADPQVARRVTRGQTPNTSSQFDFVSPPDKKSFSVRFSTIRNKLVLVPHV